jgi:hypothetical protein
LAANIRTTTSSDRQNGGDFARTTASDAEWNKVSTPSKTSWFTRCRLPTTVQQRAQSAAFVFDLHHLRRSLSDLARKLTEAQIKAFGKVDIAMIPSGGIFTMPWTHQEVLQQLKPKIAIPMHYRENTALLDMFVKGYPNKYLNNYKSTFSKTALPPPTQVVVFTPWQMRDYRRGTE